MKKEMFNNRYGLNTAVLEDRKTQTRRLSGLYDQTMNPHLTLLLRSEKGREEFIAKKSRYKIGEVVAIAQSYRDCAEEDLKPKFKGQIYPPYNLYDDTAGWDNKINDCNMCTYQVNVDRKTKEGKALAKFLVSIGAIIVADRKIEKRKIVMSPNEVTKQDVTAALKHSRIVQTRKLAKYL